MRFAQYALLSVEGLIGKMTNIYPLNPRFMLPFVFVLALSLLFLLPSGLAQAQTANQFFTYPENGTGPVATFTASDPEGAMPVVWSLPGVAVPDRHVEVGDVVDSGDFKIDQNGVLSFMASPDFEVPADDGTNNVYRVTVQASDGGNVDYFEVYVEVIDVEETGKVTWTANPDGTDDEVPVTVVLRQFQPGAVLSASVTDPDITTGSPVGTAAAAGITWKWYRSSTEIAGAGGTGPDFASYTVTDSDVGMHIRIVATYSDGDGPEESASFTSETPVQAFRLSNSDPEFVATTVTRRIAENSTGNVGGPITATDANNGDILTYAIATGNDGTNFRIDAASGQLMVGPDTDLDFETTNSYTVGVTAYDSFGIGTDPVATVTINVFNVDEKPEFDDVEDQNVTGAIIAENAMAAALDIATYVAMDPESEDVTLSLMGDDAGLFELAADTLVDGNNDVSQVLSFKKSPDFEMPGDRNTDNVYEVTVRASDGTLNADLMVTVKVTNLPEVGKVTLSSEDALVGVELTATLTDLEGGVSASGQITGESWTWHSGNTDEFTLADDAVGIGGATSSTYTPVAADADTTDAGYLRARVSYTYQFGAKKMGTSDAVQVQAIRENQAPKFKDGASTFRVIAEDAAPDDTDDNNTDVLTDNVGLPVEATDANGDTLTYALSRPDAANFRIRSDGQIEVKAGAKLDHETKPTLTVTVTVNDGSGASNATATITVTIYVTDVDEGLTIKDRADPTADEQTVDYPENGTGPVATFTVSDPEGASPIVWSLDGADAGDFTINGGVLNFKASPDYESARASNTYMVTVQASVGDEVDSFAVTANVTNVEEEVTVTWNVGPGPDGTQLSPARALRQFQPGAILAATVTDPDSETLTGTTTWKWYRSSTEISGETGNNYIVKDADFGMRIRVVATYSDGDVPEESASLTSEAPVQAARLPTANDAPVFASLNVDRRIAENTTGNVGGAVTATDANSDDILTYFITGGADQADFDINPATGQLMVGDDVVLNYEDAQHADHEYVVQVTAYDSSGDTPAVTTVTITIYDVDEKPTFGAVMDDANITRASIVENATILNVATYTAIDPEGESVTLSLMGDDAGLFELDDDGLLSFKKKPDFEMPGDRNEDNVYEVTVRASDGTLNADRMVAVKVTNDDDEGGTVTLSSEEALVGVELTATLTDLEGGVSASGQITDQKWTWNSLTATEVTTTGAVGTPIMGATSSTYTPGSDDAGMYVRAMVSYTYQFGATKMGTSDAVQVQAIRENQAPKFKDGASTFRVIAEDAAPDDTDDNNTDVLTDNVGLPVEATDANGDMPTYTLGGSDAANFRIRSDGQIEVKAGAKLDYETKPRLMVTLTANDGSGESNATATITVTIYVSDVDEDPTIMASGVTIDLSISGATDTVYPENGLDAVATYMLTGTNAASATWSLEGADSGDFTINGGALRFRGSPDYETPTDANGDNIYMVTVKASDGTDMDTHEVTVTVIDVAEVPPVIIDLSISGQTSPVYAENRTGAVATYTVAGTNAASATWSLEGTDAVDFTISSGGVLRFRDSPDHEMPADNNTDNIYMVTVNASDGTDMATHEVTVTVTDVDEVPTIAGDATIDYAENGTGDVATYTAMDPEGTAISWSLAGDDAVAFDITDGALTFMASPDYEMPADADTDNMYSVTIQVTDQTMNTGMKEVTVTVTDVNEMAPEMSLLERYDADDNGQIDVDELREAITHYILGDIDVDDVREIIRLYILG